MGLDQYIINRKDTENEELFYFRKVNSLHGYFEEKFDIGNVEQINLTTDTCIDILNKATKAMIEEKPEHFPPKAGFFYGSTEIGPNYWLDLRKIINAMTDLLSTHREDLDNGRIYYYAWW